MIISQEYSNTLFKFRHFNYDPAEDAAKAACGDPDGTWTPGGGEKDDSVPVDELAD